MSALGPLHPPINVPQPPLLRDEQPSEYIKEQATEERRQQDMREEEESVGT